MTTDDALAAAVAALAARTGGRWTGTATDLLAALAEDVRPPTASGLAMRLRRSDDALTAAGIEVRRHRRDGVRVLDVVATDRAVTR
ncbi:hypothetical protein [Pseudonocardia alni]|uniref:Uncharacterized protein n=1 Tax=Pseudonocardia alni TaxID=33907 RepID=A0A852W1S7_PSEA5|nr:hypothetical protein [Pseudonocardia antarctica]NYG00365.1 hypothetical protein [Pseudonocardia antarctica]